MDLIRFLARFSLYHPLQSATSAGKVLNVPMAGRCSANGLVACPRKRGIRVSPGYYIQPDGSLRLKVDMPDRAIDIIESLD